MHVPDIALHEATSLEQAAELLRQNAPDVRPLAGGTDLLVDLKSGRVRCKHVVSLNRIESLRGVTDTPHGLRIGALTTITQLDRSPIVRDKFTPLRDATQRMAAHQVRNVATVGGNIASAVPCADLPPILIAMNASVELWSSNGTRHVPLDSFFEGPRQTSRKSDELLVAILVPTLPAGFGAAYARFQLRDGNAIAVASVAASLLLENSGSVRDARIVLGAVAPIPKLVEAAGAALAGRPPDEDAFACAAEIAMKAAEPICDVRGSAEYRRELTGVLTQRALTAALARAKEVA